MTSIETAHPVPPKPIIDVELNGKEVKLDGHVQTGLEIKQAAITQGVAIQLDFQLSRRIGRRWEIINDNETVTITERAEFRAVDSDDNS